MKSPQPRPTVILSLFLLLYLTCSPPSPVSHPPPHPTPSHTRTLTVSHCHCGSFVSKRMRTNCHLAPGQNPAQMGIRAHVQTCALSERAHTPSICGASFIFKLPVHSNLFISQIGLASQIVNCLYQLIAVRSFWLMLESVEGICMNTNGSIQKAEITQEF